MKVPTGSIPIFPDLAGKFTLVTGSSRGIGAETARYLAANKAKVVVNGRDRDALDRVVADLESSGVEAFGVIADCTKSEQIEEMRRKVEDRFGDIDLLMAFAGGGSRIEPIDNVSEKEWNSLMAASLTSKFLTIKTFLPGMKRRGAGSIVLVCSSAGVPHQRLRSRIPRHKQVLSCLRDTWLSNIRVNAIAPSAIWNERMERFMSKEQQEGLAASFAIHRIGEPRDIAAATLFLCSVASSWITGVTLDIAGGKVMA